MPAPLGKHEQYGTWRKPWSYSTGSPRPKGRPMTKTSQEEIDICLNCKRTSCDHGNCDAIHMFDRRTRTKMLPVPSDFRLMASIDGNTIPVLSEHYGVAEYMVIKWRRAIGIRSEPAVVDEEEFVRDARAGTRLRDMMDKYHIGNSRAHALYEKYGIPIPPKAKTGTARRR